MDTRRSRKPSPTKRLTILAMEFRGTKDQTERLAIARAYAQAVDELIASRKWNRMPPLEDQLPDEWMPETFFTHWELRPPLQQAKRTG